MTTYTVYHDSGKTKALQARPWVVATTTRNENNRPTSIVNTRHASEDDARNAVALAQERTD